MKISTEVMSAPVKFVVVEEPSEIIRRKKEAYEAIKETLPPIAGFRQGHIPQNLAENHFGADYIYSGLVNKMYDEVAQQNRVVSSVGFRFFGDLKSATNHFIMEFIAEVKPTVTLVDFDIIHIDREKDDVSDEEIDAQIKFDIRQCEKIEDSDKPTLENLDVAVIDFEGRIDGTVFKGGTAKGYQLCINEIVDGKKQFIGNFEDQLVGMIVGEVREVKVQFPEDYRDKSKAGKNAIFSVTLHGIKTKSCPVLDDEFAKTKGFASTGDYVADVVQNLTDRKKKHNFEKFRRDIVIEIVKKSHITPVPMEMIKAETEQKWGSHLNKMGKTEKDYVKENKNGKEQFFDSNENKSREIIKTAMTLEQIAKDYKIEVTHDEVVTYVIGLSHAMAFSDEKKDKIKSDLEQNKVQFDMMARSARNDRVFEFLVGHFGQV